MFQRKSIFTFVFTITYLFAPGLSFLRANPDEFEPYAIIQGLTDDTTAQFAVVAPMADRLRYRVADDQGQTIATREERMVKPYSDWIVDHVFVAGLRPGVWYTMQVIDEEGNMRDQRQFRSLDLSRSSVQFALASCINDNYDTTDTWLQLAKDRPEMLFMVGDNVYADHLGMVVRQTADPAQLWQRYVETWNNVALFKFKRLIPTLATWDDHDYGANDGDRNYPYRRESLEILMSFFAQDSRLSSHLIPGPGAATLFRAYGQNFFLLDDRSFRTEEGATQSTHWGVDQENWIAEQAKAHPFPTWIFNGSEFFGAYHGKESVEGQHLESLNRLRDNLRKLPQVFVFGSGDLHFSEVQSIEAEWLGYPTYEFTSSSINSWYITWMDRVTTNPRRIESVAAHNYMMITSTVTPKGLAIQSIVRGSDDTEYFRIEGKVER